MPLETYQALEADGVTETEMRKLPDTGQQASADSLPMVLSTQQEAIFTAIKTAVENMGGYTDGIETLLTALQNLMTTQAGYVDGLEALVAATNGYVDGLEGGVAGTTTAVDALGTLLGPVDASVPAGDTDDSDINGRLQKLAVGITSLLSKTDQSIALLTSAVDLLDDPVTSLPVEALNTVVDFSIAPINSTSTANNELVGAQAGEVCRVYGLQFETNAACTITLKRGSTTLRTWTLPAGAIVVYELRARPRWVTGTAEALNLTSSTADAVTGQVEYVRS